MHAPAPRSTAETLHECWLWCIRQKVVHQSEHVPTLQLGISRCAHLICGAEQ